ncbi:MAG: HEPN domain-containing protein [Gemmatimonadetes bacterium]|nr:HEPN domain-containing protein [Gemmatimonadota bacterium]
MTKQLRMQSGSSKNQDLTFVRCFLSDLLDNVSPFRVIPNILGSSWWQKDEGLMFLEPETLAEYRDIRQKLLEKFAPDEDLSESAIDSALRTAVFEVVDIPKRRDQNLSVRLDHALEKLRTFLASPSEEYECWIEVGGLDVVSLPTCFGGVRFIVFGAEQIQNLKEAGQKKHIIGQLEGFIDLLTDRLLDRPTAVVRVNARDKKAALSLAERKVRAIIECLNFFSDTISGYHGWLFLPTNQESPSEVARLAVSDSGSMETDYSDDRPVGIFSIAEVRENAEEMVRCAFDRVESLLEKSRNDVDELLLTAIRWAGRATVARTREESFLLFVIALECLVLPTEKDKLRSRLSQRVARLCGEDMDQRLELAKRTKKLYDVRSKIVHSGHYEVTEDERDEIRIAAKVVILRLLTDPDVEKYGKLDKLHEYFERLTFK